MYPKRSLDPARSHTRNGSIDDEVESEAEAFRRAKQFLSYLPSNVDELPPRVDCVDPTDRQSPELNDIVPRDPRKVYKMRRVIETIVDAGSFFEIGKKWGKSVITGLARLDGLPVAIFAEDPMIYGGAWTADSCKKLVRFCDLASTFHLPLIHLVDCPGFLIGKQSEESGTIRVGSTALAALGQTTVPFCSVIIRKAFASRAQRIPNPDITITDSLGPLAIGAHYPSREALKWRTKHLAESDNPEQLLADIKARLNKVRSPFRSAEFFEIEDIIEPARTRETLCQWANLAAEALQPGPSRFGYRP